MSSIESTDVDLVTTLVRRQGEELLKVRKDLEESKKLYTTAVDVVSTSKFRVENAIRTSSQWQSKFATMISDLSFLQSEHEASLAELKATCTELRATLGLFNSRDVPTIVSAPESPISNANPVVLATPEDPVDGYTSESSISDISVDEKELEHDESHETHISVNSVEVVAGDFVNVAAVETELESVSSQDSVLDDVPGVDDSYVEGDDHSNDAKVGSSVPRSVPQSLLSASTATPVLETAIATLDTVLPAPLAPVKTATAVPDGTSESDKPKSNEPSIAASFPKPASLALGPNAPAVPESSNATFNRLNGASFSSSVFGRSSSPASVPTVTPIPQSSNAISAQSNGTSSVPVPSTSTAPATPKGSNSNPPVPAMPKASSSASVPTASPVPKSSIPLSAKASASVPATTATPVPKSTNPITAKPNGPPPVIATSSSVQGFSLANTHLSMDSAKPICTKLPAVHTRKVVKDMCLKAIGSPGKTTYHIFNIPEVLLAYPSGRNLALITVSKRANEVSSNLTKFSRQWKGHVLSQNSATKHLFFLGEFQGGASYKLSVNEYNLLPAKTKKCVFNAAKSLRYQDIQDQNQMLLSMGKDNGIYVAKTELRFTSDSSAIEAAMRQEATTRGFV
ncbi:MAG: hypothetical protein NXY57DRAFT_1006557 [Lentinula lateritia]|uniref:Uncharacterized protein n=1 Tax=Lentinula lateritia TaxID=40482 RepID=A0ABQ8VJI9_9AGAR|nr:MAG: hypothetical protein NXY57DRAFT_1006557 [Lentinula lateritia]KAJ4491649.1 hypothetical protein C8R41DRAFT_981387 [Lentinula lateritia]